MKLSIILQEWLKDRASRHFISVASLRRLNAAIAKLEEETDEKEAAAIIDEVLRERYLDE